MTCLGDSKDLNLFGGSMRKDGRIIWEKDGTEMVLIPAGSFEIGDDSELPIHEVELDAFYMDTSQVTVGQFKQFVGDSGYDYDDWDYVAEYSPTNQHPMIYVDWNDAVAYAEWAGKRLPTEAEWEYAARGGLRGKRYPWGDEAPTAEKANYGGNVGKATTVNSYAANGYGLYDMAGNVWEWCVAEYDEDYYQNASSKNLPGPDSGSDRVLRGGSWRNDANALRVAGRINLNPPSGSPNSGFRCVWGSN